MTLGGERFFSTHTNPCATARNLCRRDHGGPSLKESAFPFGNQAEIIQEGPAKIPEQYASGPDSGKADREIGILRQVMMPDHEPCFKASMPSYSRGQINRAMIGAARCARRGFQDGGLRWVCGGPLLLGRGAMATGSRQDKGELLLFCKSVGQSRTTNLNVDDSGIWGGHVFGWLFKD